MYLHSDRKPEVLLTLKQDKSLFACTMTKVVRRVL